MSEYYNDSYNIDVLKKFKAKKMNKVYFIGKAIDDQCSKFEYKDLRSLLIDCSYKVSQCEEIKKNLSDEDEDFWQLDSIITQFKATKELCEDMNKKIDKTNPFDISEISVVSKYYFMAQSELDRYCNDKLGGEQS